MRRLTRIALRITLVLFLTILTQIGGLIYLLNHALWVKLKSKSTRLKRLLSFLCLYSLATFIFVPMLSPRKALPGPSAEQLHPRSAWTCILNRHYVDPELFNVLHRVSENFPYSIVYLDAGFPFVDGFPLLPHLSHDDGEKVDLAFMYGTGGTDLENEESATFLGYGSFELPENAEFDTAADCESKGHWQYSMTKIFPASHTEATFHAYRTKTLVLALAKEPRVQKIFIEPHLKSRLGLTNSKVRFHGCHAVRHDDHIHVQL